MHCRTLESCKCKRNLGFKLYDVINCKEQTVLESIKDTIEGENMKLNSVYQAAKLIFFFFHDYKLVIEVDELCQNNGNIDYEIQRQKLIEKKLVVCSLELILMKNISKNLKKIFEAMNERNRHIKK